MQAARFLFLKLESHKTCQNSAAWSEVPLAAYFSMGTDSRTVPGPQQHGQDSSPGTPSALQPAERGAEAAQEGHGFKESSQPTCPSKSLLQTEGCSGHPQGNTALLCALQQAAGNAHSELPSESRQLRGRAGGRGSSLPHGHGVRRFGCRWGGSVQPRAPGRVL